MRMYASLRCSYILLLLSFPLISSAQYKVDLKANAELLQFEMQIDNAIVAADISFLQRAYAEDFHFKHGTGHIDDKASWIKDVAKNKGLFISRTLDSVDVEIHKNVGITNGHLTVVRRDRTYNLRYVRVYIRDKDQWQMIMHRTVQEFDQ